MASADISKVDVYAVADRTMIIKHMCWNDQLFEGQAAYLGVSSDCLSEYRAMFQLFDKDQKGSITTPEFKTILYSIGNDIYEDDLQNMITAMDEEGAGDIEFPEFIIAVYKILDNVKSVSEITELFKVLDVDGDGAIRKNDLRKLSSCFGLKLTNNDMDDMFIDACDEDKATSVNQSEFKLFLESWK